MTIDALEVRAPKVRDRLMVEQQKGTAAEKELKFFAYLCGQDPELLMELELKDYLALQSLVHDFLS